MKKQLALVLAAACAAFPYGCGKVSAHSGSSSATEASSEAPTEATSGEEVATAAPTTEAPTTTAQPATEPPKPPADLVLKGAEKVEVYSDVKLSDFITEKNVELAEPDALLDASGLGEREVEVKYISGGAEFSEKLKYTVVDATPPVILNAGWNPYHQAGTPFDLGKYVGFGDNYDAAPTLTFEGDIDPNAVGSYPLRAAATDSSGNRTEWDVTIEVVDAVPATPDDRARVPFADFAAKYGGEGRKLGLDISAWQTNVDFGALKASGCDFVVMRAGYCYGTPKQDDYYAQNLQRARESGIDYSVYYYFTDSDEEEVREHARWIADSLGGEPTKLPIGFDWEEFGGFQRYGMSLHKLNELYAAFHDELSKRGYETMLYSSRNFLLNVWEEKTKALGPVWLAHYVDETNYEGDYYIWQQSSCGRIDGIAGDVDMNVLYER